MNNCMNYTIVLNSGLLFVENPHPFPKWEIQVLQFVWTEILIPHSRQKSESPIPFTVAILHRYLFGMIVWVKVVFRKTACCWWLTFWLPERQSSSESREESSSDDGVYVSCLGSNRSVLSWCDWSSKHESCSDWSVVVAVIFDPSVVCWFRLRSCMSCL